MSFFRGRQTNPLELRDTWSSCTQVTNTFLAIPLCPRKYLLPSSYAPLQMPGDTNHTDNTGKNLMNWKVKTWLYMTRKVILTCLCSKQKSRVQVKGNDRSFSDLLGKQQ